MIRMIILTSLSKGCTHFSFKMIYYTPKIKNATKTGSARLDYGLHIHKFVPMYIYIYIYLYLLYFVINVLSLDSFLASMFFNLSCFPPFSLTPHTTLLSETHLAYPIVFFPLVFFL